MAAPAPDCREPSAGWRGGNLIAIGLLVMPTVATALAITLVLTITSWLARSAGQTPALAGPAAVRLMALGFYAVAAWVTTGLLWPGPFSRFVVCIAVAVSVVSVAVMRPLSAWFAASLGLRGMGREPDLHQPAVLALVVFAGVVTAPICEEVLFRGLAVAWLRAHRLPASVVWLLASLAFAAIHLPIYGIA